MRTQLALTLAAAALFLAACGGTQMSTIIETVGDGPQISAKDIVFDRTELEVPANEAIGLRFQNFDGAPHNVAIYVDESASQPIFVGEIFGGPGSRVYQLPAIPAGTYAFRCDVHPEMHGTFVATP